MKLRLFAIPSLLAAGLLPSKGLTLPLSSPPTLGPEKNKSIFDIFRLDHVYTLAGHRSHSSHRSHASHTSHRSSTGGSYYSPSYSPSPSYATPLYSPPPVASTPRTSTAPSITDSPATGSYATTPAPALSAPMELGPDPVPPTRTGPVTLPGNTDKFAAIVRQVQAAMVAFGYYSGAVDGKVGPRTREALTRLQTDYGLKPTGTITLETLNSLRITAQ